MRRNRVVWVGFVLAAALGAGGCSSETSSSPSAPTPAFALTGRWAGDILVEGTPARMTWTLSQNGGAVAGTALVQLSSGTVLLNGNVSGTISGSTLTYTLAVGAGGIPTQPSCSGRLGGSATASASEPFTLTGTYALIGSSCPSPLTGGSFVLTKVGA